MSIATSALARPRRGRLYIIIGAVLAVLAFATADGKQVWEFDTVRDFVTTNGVTAKGGAMGAPGPTIAGGLMFVGSGYTGLGNGRGGNVLLAFSADESRSTK